VEAPAWRNVQGMFVDDAAVVTAMVCVCGGGGERERDNERGRERVVDDAVVVAAMVCVLCVSEGCSWARQSECTGG
jgi:hypothetical protein